MGREARTTVTKDLYPDLGKDSYACTCPYCVNNPKTVDLSYRGYTIAPGNAVQFIKSNYRVRCELWCNDVRVADASHGGGGDMTSSHYDIPFPEQCTGTTKVKVIGGGYCGGCRFKGSRLFVYKSER